MTDETIFVPLLFETIACKPPDFILSQVEYSIPGT